MEVIPDANTLSRNDGVTHYGTITAISESPFREGVIYAGTDDGLIQVSRDDGKTWKNVTPPPALVPKNTYLSRVEASHFSEGRVYASLDGHRGNDFKPYVLASEDFGGRWKILSGRLPEFGTVSVVREDRRNPDLLFVGTERGAFFSLDRGVNWTRIKSNMPLVPVDDIAIRPWDNDLIFGTHGRSIWILDDITPLVELKADTLAAKSYLFDIRPALVFSPYSHKGDTGHKFFVGANPPQGALISYYLKEDGKEEARIIVTDTEGKTIRELKGVKEAGLHRLNWDLCYAPLSGEAGTTARFSSFPPPYVLPGEYRVTLQAAGQEMIKMVKVEGDPRIDVTFEARKAQHDALMSLYRLGPLLSATEKTMDTLRRQLEEAEAMSKKAASPPAEVSEAIKAVLAELQAVRKELLGDPQAGFQAMRLSVRGRLISLARSIGGYTGAPSERQVQNIAKYTERLMALVEKINLIIDQDVPRLNKLMIENNVPYIAPLEKIRLDQ